MFYVLNPFVTYLLTLPRITRTAYKTTPTRFRFGGNVFTKPLPSNDGGIHRQTHRLSFDSTNKASRLKSIRKIKLASDVRSSFK
jgi:hypothetical protein